MVLGRILVFALLVVSFIWITIHESTVLICWISRVTLLLNWVKFSGVMVGLELLGIQSIIVNCFLDL